jgi:hypothetical protein
MAHPESVQYRREFVRSFNQSVSLLSDRCTEESMSSGRSAVFDVADLGGDLAQRSVDGRLPRLTSSDSQVTCTLEEYGGTLEVTNFEKFTSQSDERAKMSAKIMARTNRRLDRVLLAELDNASQYASGAAQTMTSAVATTIIATLAEGEVDISPGDITFVISPMAHHQLMKAASYTSADYVSAKPFDGNAGQYSNERKIKSWLDIGWIVSPLLTGVGTNSCKMFIFHRNAIGCAKPSEQINYSAGWDDQHHYHYCSGTMKAGVKILQTGGVLEVIHDDTAA